MQIQQNISLKQYNTFGIDVSAKYFSIFSTLSELQKVLSQESVNKERMLILGGGSNILLTQNFDGLVIKNELKGINVIQEDDEHVYVKANAGENWHSFVLHCIRHGYAGAENLSLIPGNVGAAPMQNIGAYGVEIKDIFYDLNAYHLKDKTIVNFSSKECAFGYRESIFKGKYKGQFVITDVTFRLNKKAVFNTSYGAIQQELENMQVKEISIANISQAVINIRSSKLPDPKVIGNAGSFFKNPTISKQHFEEIKNQFPGVVGYPINDQIKVAAGWLIEQCGWKGYRKGDAGCHAKQALVLVNYGHAKGIEIFELSSEILLSIKKKFDIALEREVNII